jgi:hypothetical protein
VCVGVPSPCTQPCRVTTQYGSRSLEGIAMKRDWFKDGWRRFLDRLKDLWGKRTGPDSATAWLPKGSGSPVYRGAWCTFDARNNTPRIGRGLPRGRDAADVEISVIFALNALQGFRIWADEVKATQSLSC